MKSIFHQISCSLIVAALLVVAGCGDVDPDSSADGRDKTEQTEDASGGNQKVD